MNTKERMFDLISFVCYLGITLIMLFGILYVLTKPKYTEYECVKMTGEYTVRKVIRVTHQDYIYMELNPHIYTGIRKMSHRNFESITRIVECPMIKK